MGFLVSEGFVLRKTYTQWVAEVRATYLRRRVRFWIRRGVCCEGEVVSVDDRGGLWVLYGYDEQDCPLYHVVSVPMFGGFAECLTVIE